MTDHEYAPPRIETRDQIDLPLVGGGSGNIDSAPSAAFRSV